MNRKVVEMLRELNAEQAGLVRGAPDLPERLAVLQTRADELSPVWGLDFESRNGQQTVFVRLKPNTPPQATRLHVDAAEDDPAAPDPTQAIVEALQYGSGTVIEPGTITRIDNEAIAALNLPCEQVGMVLPDQRITEGFPRTATLRPRHADGTTGRRLYLTWQYATKGSRGMYVHGADSTGMLRLRLRVDRPDVDDSSNSGSNVGMLLQYGPEDAHYADSVDPEALLRTVDVLDALDRAPGMVLMLAEQIELEAQHRTVTGHFAPIATALRDFVLVREQLDMVLPLPVSWSRTDTRNIAILACLFRGEEVSLPLRTMVCHQYSTPEEARLYLEYIEEGYGARIDFEMVGLALPVGTVTVQIGPLFVAFSRARITNAAEVSAALTAGDHVPGHRQFGTPGQ